MFAKSLIFFLVLIFVRASNVESDSVSSSPSTKTTLSLWTNLMISQYSVSNVNVSIIAFKNIYDPAGKIIQVDTVELVFPGRENSQKSILFESSKKDLLESTDRGVQHKLIENLRPYSRLSEIGYFVDAFLEYSTDDQHSVLFYWNSNTTYYRGSDGLVTLNKTFVSTKQEVDDFLDKLKHREDLHVRPIYAKFDSNGNIKYIESRINRPAVVSYVADSWNASDAILLGAPTSLTELFLTVKRQNLPKELAEDFNQRFVEYEWRVLVNPGKAYVNSNVWIKLGLDGYEFYTGQDEIYFMYGILKE